MLYVFMPPNPDCRTKKEPVYGKGVNEDGNNEKKGSTASI
jgi:hypothetical protein